MAIKDSIASEWAEASLGEASCWRRLEAYGAQP